MSKKGNLKKMAFGFILKKNAVGLSELLENGLDPNLQTEFDQTAGAWISVDNIDNKEGDTLLIAAIRSGNKEIVELLLEKGADPEKQNRANYPPIHIACAVANLEIINMILEHNPLILYPEQLLTEVIKQDSRKVNLESEEVEEILSRLIEFGCKFDDDYNNPANPLKVVLENGTVETLNILLQTGAKTDVLDFSLWNPLSGSTNNEEMVATIIENDTCGDDLKSVYKEISVAFFNNKYEKVLDIIRKTEKKIKKKAATFALIIAVEYGDEGFAEKLAEKEYLADYTVKDKDGNNLIYLATIPRSFHLIKMLIKAGCDINEKNNFGNTPVIEMLRRWNRTTAYTKGVEWNSKELEKFIELGANIDINKKDKKGYTPLDYARYNEEVKNFLLKLKKKVKTKRKKK